MSAEDVLTRHSIVILAATPPGCRYALDELDHDAVAACIRDLVASLEASRLGCERVTCEECEDAYARFEHAAEEREVWKHRAETAEAERDEAESDVIDRCVPLQEEAFDLRRALTTAREATTRATEREVTANALADAAGVRLSALVGAVLEEREARFVYGVAARQGDADAFDEADTALDAAKAKVGALLHAAPPTDEDRPEVRYRAWKTSGGEYIVERAYGCKEERAGVSAETAERRMGLSLDEGEWTQEEMARLYQRAWDEAELAAEAMSV